MRRQELLQPCCSSRCAWSVPLGHEAVLTPLGVCDGDRPFSERSPQPELSEDEEVHDVTIIRPLLLCFSPDNALARAG